jgi:L-fuconolactonase
LRLDAHHSFSEHYPLATLDFILKRSRFDGSILVTEGPDNARGAGGLAAEPPDRAAARHAGSSRTGAWPSGHPVGERPTPLNHVPEGPAAGTLGLSARGGIGPPDLAALPEFVRGVVIQADRVDPRLLDQYQRDSRFRGLLCRPAAGGPESVPENVLENLGELERLAWVPRIAERFPALRVAIVHLGSPAVGSSGDWDRWAAALEAAARIPQVCCKLSGLLGLGVPGLAAPHLAAAPSLSAGGALGARHAEDLRPYVRHALAVFGPGRLMFGSGWPACLPEHTWKETLALFTQSIGARSIEVREQLLGATAARFYGIAA